MFVHISKYRKKLFFSTVLVLFSYSNTFAHIDHTTSYNKTEYELFRNNRLIGSHNFDFVRSGDKLTVNSVVRFKVTKLGIDLYEYEAKSQENYKNNTFLSFSSKTNQNKKQKYVNVKLNKNLSNLKVDGSSFKGVASKDFIVGTWWNHEIIKAKAQISAISGRIIEQNVNFIGKENIKINGRDYKALHFNFSSADENLPPEKKLNTDIWYDATSHLWLKAAFDKKGYWEYRIKNYN